MNKQIKRITKSVGILILMTLLAMVPKLDAFAQSKTPYHFDSSGIQVGTGNKNSVKSITKVTGQKQTYSDSKITFDTVLEVDGVVIYDFEKKKNVGSTTVPNITINYEGYYGTTAEINENILTYSYYNYTDTASNTAVVEIYKQGTSNAITRVGNVGTEEHKINLSKLNDGLYYILATVTDNKKTNSTKQYFYLNGSDRYLCSVGGRIYDSILTITNGKLNLTAAMKDIKPEECLNLTNLTYPTSGANGHVNHVKLWVEKGRSLVNEDWSDERKVFTFTQWLAKNIAYDHYKVHYGTRARLVSTKTYDGYTDDKNFSYFNGVGVCWDYTNILNIMCRAHGIPATSIDTDVHTYSVVYLDGHWVPIDIVMFYAKECNNKDTSKIAEREQRDQRFTNGYGTYSMVANVKSVGRQMWTYKNATDPTNALKK